MNLMNMLTCIDIMKSEATCIFLNGRTMTSPCLDTKCRAYCAAPCEAPCEAVGNGSTNICAAPCEAVGKKINCHCYGYTW